MNRSSIVAALCALAVGLVLTFEPGAARAESWCSSTNDCKKICTSDKTGAACYRAATFYRTGMGVPVDMAKAAHGLEMACTKGFALACLDLSELYRDGWMFAVTKDPARSEELSNRAYELANVGCGEGDSDDCFTLAKGNLLYVARAGWPADGKGQSKEITDPAEKACRKGHVSACEWIAEKASELRSHELADEKEYQRLRKLSADQIPEICRSQGNARACSLALEIDDDDEKRSKVYAEKACAAGDTDGCFYASMLAYQAKHGDGMPNPNDPELTALLEIAFKGCDKGQGRLCSEVVELFLEGEEDLKIRPDRARAINVLAAMCNRGQNEACDQAAKLLLDGKPTAKARARASRHLARACRATPYGSDCSLCKVDDKHSECQLRVAWKTRLECIDDRKERRCETLGDMFRDGTAIERNTTQAAGFYRLACDSAVKNACSSLSDMCASDPTLPQGLCQQSLIHSDFFYEAEWQYRQTGKASLRDADRRTKDGNGAPAPSMSVDGGASAQIGIKLERGSLDADLVVSIVLDRARQAALRLVVDELRRSGLGDRVPGYLNDLLAQAALLLTDTNTLRREKFQDLGMTVVRAFIASNLIRTLYGTDDELLDAREHGAAEARWTAWLGAGWDRDAFTRDERNPIRLRTYLTDWAYYVLGTESLFARADSALGRTPKCQFDRDPGKLICAALEADAAAGGVKLERLLRVEAVLKGLRLAKLIKEQGGVDLRRFVEALGSSKTIASLETTPGLNLKQWETELAGFEQKLDELRVQTAALRNLLRRNTFQRAEIDWREVENEARAASAFLRTEAYRALLGRRNVELGLELTEMILTKAPRKGGGLVGAAEEVDQRPQLALEILQRWAARRDMRVEEKLAGLEESAKKVEVLLPDLNAEIRKIRALMSRHVEEGAGLSLDELPLHALGELQFLFEGVRDNLHALDGALSEVFPGMAAPKVRFAESAVIRLLAFLELMDRVARTARLNQSFAEITGSLKMLGARQGGTFVAPLFDIMDPVLVALETHRPLDADVLFAIISKVRLDSLITTLASPRAGKPCESNDRGTDCWTVKVVHALQESIQRDGASIRVDGSKFATRLASHGDDFRRRHKGGRFLHLTIGFGGLLSFDPPAMDGSPRADGNRVVPLVAEQIGIGWASPTFGGDRFTFKVGAFASGILFRSVMDSAESNAITLGGFLALDVYDLVELYVAPGALIYPPVGDTDIGARPGISFGLQVPLGAYLSKVGVTN